MLDLENTYINKKQDFARFQFYVVGQKSQAVIFEPEFSEPALPRQSILGLGRLGREADLRVTGTNLLFGFFEKLSQNSLLY